MAKIEKPESLFRAGFPFSRKSEPAKAPEAQPAPAAPAPKPVPAQPAQPSQRERRRSPRQTMVAKLVIRPDVSLTMPAMVATGFVSNISMGGIGFHTRRPLSIGEKYRLNIELGPMKWSSRMRVISCAQHPKTGTFDVGAEFVSNDLVSRTPQVAA